MWAQIIGLCHQRVRRSDDFAKDLFDQYCAAFSKSSVWLAIWSPIHAKQYNCGVHPTQRLASADRRAQAAPKRGKPRVTAS
jgi:hypothetical protein